MKLQKNEYCPIDRSLFCWGRGSQGAAEEWAAFRSMDAQLSEKYRSRRRTRRILRGADRITEDLHDSRPSPRPSR